jgi:hypothetical protein
MRFRSISGPASAAVGIIGTGLALALPEQKWIGFILIALGLATFIIGVRDEGCGISPGNPSGKHVSHWGPWVLIISGPLIGFLWLYFTPVSPANTGIEPSSEKNTETTENSPPIGSLRYVKSWLVLEHNQSTNEWAGQVKVELENTSDKLIFFRAITAGNINGAPFTAEKASFDGYIPPNGDTTLMSKRIIGFPIDPKAGFAKPIAMGIFEYDLSYGFTDQKAFTRRTAKGLRIEFRGPLPENRPVGLMLEENITVGFYGEREE